MSTVYPAALDNIPEGENLVTAVDAALINSMVDPINSIEATLGTNPQGNLTTVGNRLSAIVDVNGLATITGGKVDGVLIGSIAPPNATLNNVTINGSFTGPFVVSSTYGTFSDLESRLEAYELDGHAPINDAIPATDIATSLSNRLNMLATQIRLITGTAHWDSTVPVSLVNLSSQISSVQVAGWVTSVRIAQWDGTPAGDPTTGTGIDTSMYRDFSITSSKIAVWDGTTAYNSTSGSGIANQHLKALVVTNDKIALNAITTPLISPWDGSSGPTSLTGSGVGTPHLKGACVTVEKMDPTIIPVGSTVLFPNTVAVPTNWLQCNGATVAQASFPELFAVIGTTFGGTSPNFKLPNISSGVSHYIYMIKYA